MIRGGNLQLERLVALQQIDNEIRELKQGLTLIPGQIEAARKELEGKKSRLKEVQEVIDDLRKQRSQMEQDVKEHQDHLIKTQLKLPAVKTNQEYTALLKEVDTIKEQITRIEDRELDLMEVLEAKEAEIPLVKQECEGFEKEFNEYKATKENEQKRVNAEIEEIGKRRQEIREKVDPQLAKQYEKVLNHLGDFAVVALKGETCQGCFHQIQPQVALEVKSSDKLIHSCQFCQRYLYVEAEPENEAESAVTK